MKGTTPYLSGKIIGKKMEDMTEVEAPLVALLSAARAESKAKDDLIIALARQAALGGLVSHLAHQWRQPLNVLALDFQALQMLGEAGSLDEKALDRYVRKGLDEIEGLSALLDEYRTYYKPESVEGTRPVRDAIDGCFRLLSPSIERLRVRTRIECPPDLGLRERPGELRELLVMLVGRSLAAFKGGSFSAPEISLRAWVEPDAFAWIEIRDNAGPIPVEGIGRIFEPDFAAATGLYAARLIAERSLAGSLAAAPWAEGTLLTLRFPPEVAR